MKSCGIGLCAVQRRTEGFVTSLWLGEALCPGDGMCVGIIMVN